MQLMNKSGIAAALVSAACVIGSAPAFAQTKVFWTTSGFNGPFSITAVLPTLPKERDRVIRFPVSMWIVDHPKGLVVFDTGNNVAVIDNCKSYWAPGLCDFLKPSQKREEVIDMQLEKLGYSVDQVKVVVTSHAHLDHIGNIEMFPKALHVIQKKELYQAWFPEKFQGRANPGLFVMEDLDNAREFNFLELDGDYDLFGDGSVLILSTPGHTLGHQSMKVKLASGRSVILAADAVWMKENLEGYPDLVTYSVKDYADSISRLKFMRDLEGAEIFMAHDQDQYKEKGGKWYK
jgi:glyoxylase-like metal-dependent hydrolase (beta-lactamase superfamily II)